MKAKIGYFLVILLTSQSFFLCKAQSQSNTDSTNLQTFNIYLINGYGIAYDYLKTDLFYLRAKLDLELNGENSDSDDQGNSIENLSTLDTTISKSEDKRVRDYFGFNFSTDIILPIYNKDYGNFYIGAGPQIGYSRMNINYNDQSEYVYSDTIYNDYNGKRIDHQENSNFDIGINILLGLCVNINSYLSFFAESHLDLLRRTTDWKANYSTSNSNNYHRTSEYSTKTNSWIYELKYLRAGVRIAL